MRQSVVLFAMLVALSGIRALGASIVGSVVDEVSGAPVPHAHVGAYLMTEEPDTGTARYVPVLSGAADEAGRFALADLPAGVYCLYVSSGSAAYIPEYYDDVPLRDGRNRSLLVLDGDTVLALQEIRLTPSPYYVEAASVEPEDLFEVGGEGTIVAKVVNTTTERAIFRFWATLELYRSDDTAFHGCISRFSAARPRAFVIWPGENMIQIPLNVPERDIPESFLHVSIHGGPSYWEPVLRAHLPRLRPRRPVAPVENTPSEAPSPPSSPLPSPPTAHPDAVDTGPPSAPETVPAAPAGRDRPSPPAAPLPVADPGLAAPLPVGAFSLPAPLPIGRYKPHLRVAKRRVATRRPASGRRVGRMAAPPAEAVLTGGAALGVGATMAPRLALGLAP
jgi:hypothetical protein